MSTNEELKDRIKLLVQSKVPEKQNLTIEKTEDGFRVDSLICTGLSKTNASVLLLLCNGLTHAQCANFLNKSVGAVEKNIQSICLKLLGSNADGNPNGTINSAITKAFNLAYLYHENISAFSATQQEWDLFISHLKFTDQRALEASRLVFVEGKTINEASIHAGVALNVVNSTVRNIEQLIGQTLEQMQFAIGVSLPD